MNLPANMSKSASSIRALRRDFFDCSTASGRGSESNSDDGFDTGSSWDIREVFSSEESSMAVGRILSVGSQDGIGSSSLAFSVSVICSSSFGSMILLVYHCSWVQPSAIAY